MDVFNPFAGIIVSLVIKKGRLRWCEYVEYKDKANWMERCEMMKIGGNRQH